MSKIEINRKGSEENKQLNVTILSIMKRIINKLIKIQEIITNNNKVHNRIIVMFLSCIINSNMSTKDDLMGLMSPTSSSILLDLIVLLLLKWLKVVVEELRRYRKKV